MAGQVARQTGRRLVSRCCRVEVRGRYVQQQLGRSMQPVASSVLLTMKEELAAFCQRSSQPNDAQRELGCETLGE
ncbi:hypothetical protein IG631_14662 [Alternaria alternata]|nr:hypothetical protein IG631_14662 [Alternaria alternata]